MKFLKTVVLLASLAIPTGVVADDVLESAYGEEVFDLFPLPAMKITSVAKPQIRGTEYWEFRTRIREGAASYLSDEFTHYAGHYALVTWGCGTSCQSGAIVDVFTGKVAWLPTASCGYAYRPYSGLLVVDPDYNPYEGSAICSTRSFYLLEHDQDRMGTDGYDPFVLIWEENTTIDRGLESSW